MSPNYVRNSISEMGLIKPRRNLLECLMVKAERVLSNGLPVMRGYAYNSDARRSPLDDGSVDLVVTSPPYLTMQTYAWDNWLRLWFLGYDYHEVARRLFHTSSLERFCQFMRETLEEIHRVLREGGRCFIVIGMVKLKGVSINMAELIAPIAERAGLHPVRIIADQIPKASKYLMYLRTDQGVSRELILELIKGDDIRSAERSGVPEAI
ncbi:MAG: DNA methyltransferase [Nitrososphaerota archaeon]|nr:DNA methyltransferase [Nitrososphaerota archaeon]